jgi:hypothetical protein
MNDLLRISFVGDSSSLSLSPPAIIIGFSWSTLIIIAILFSVAVIAYLVFVRKRILKGTTMVPVKVTFGKDITVECEIERNEENIFIAHRIYIELVTRKAAIEFDPEHDVVLEIYDSWYKLFGIVRDEIKSIPGRYLLYNRSTSELTRLTIEILNKGLRPHLTTYQATFRKWYMKESESNSNKSKTPIEIQSQFAKFDELVGDMKLVNRVLLEYADQLKNIFDQDWKKKKTAPK